MAGWAADGEEVEAFAVRARETDVRAYQGEVESLTVAESQGIGVRVVRDRRQGFAYAGTLEVAALEEALRESRDNARFATADEHAGLAAPDGVAPAALDLHRPELEDFPVEAKVELALELERATRSADPRITGVESAEYSDTVYTSAVASTAGVEATSSETGCYLSSYSLASDGDETQTGFGYSVAREPAGLDAARAAADSAERATRLLGAAKPPTARLTVVLDPLVTAQLLAIVGSALTGEAVLKGRSLFADRMGESVAVPAFTLIDDATEPAAFTASAIDDEGLATRPVELISGGVLRAFLYDSYNARRAGAVSTGSAVRPGYAGTPTAGAQALRLRPGSRSQADITAGLDDGLLVQGVTGMHSGVNPVSGDFSTGAEGLRIRGGELAEPVREVTIASTLQRLLTDVVEVGGDLEWLPMSAAGVSLAIADVTMSGA